MQVLAQGDQPAAAPSLLNGREALLLAQFSLINSALPEGPVTIGGIKGNRGSDHHTKACRDSMRPAHGPGQHQLPFLGVGIQARAVDAGAVLAHHGARGSCIQQVFEALSTRESVDLEVASIGGCDSPQPMLLGHPEQRSVSQIHRQIALLPHPARHQLQGRLNFATLRPPSDTQERKRGATSAGIRWQISVRTGQVRVVTQSLGSSHVEWG